MSRIPVVACLAALIVASFSGSALADLKIVRVTTHGPVTAPVWARSSVHVAAVSLPAATGGVAAAPHAVHVLRLCRYGVGNWVPGLFYTPRSDLFGGGVRVLTAAKLYAPGNPAFRSELVFQKPQWDSDYFLPQAGWAEQPQLWSSRLPADLY